AKITCKGRQDISSIARGTTLHSPGKNTKHPHAKKQTLPNTGLVLLSVFDSEDVAPIIDPIKTSANT
ncbi:MAG: hypothetical protein ABH837_03700, partial [bacterium]